MSETKHVLCISNDAGFRQQLAAPLEWSYPQVNVETAPGFDVAIDYLQSNDVDCVVSDYPTVREAPAILQAVRERHPDLPLLLLAQYETDADSATAVTEVVDFLDDFGTPASDEAFAGWVANAMVRGPGDATPPGGNRPEDLVRDVKQALVDADSPMDIESAVCEQLTLGGRYTFAWIGEYDRGEQEVVPWISAAVDDWPISTTFPIGDSTSSVVEHALRTRETQVVQRIDADDRNVPWREAALERDCTATLVVPLTADDELYGVLGVYTDDQGGFSEMERSAIDDIGSTVSKVLHSMALRGRIDQQERVLERYERLVETVGDGMYALDSDGHFMTVNNGLLSMTGYAREGLLGEHISIIMDDDDVARGREAIRGMLSDGRETTALEMDVVTKSGAVIPCENQIALLERGDNDFTGTVGVLRDITERKKRERELRRQNERLEAFASIVSHDLRNPLSVAQGYLDLAIEQTDSGRLDHVQDALDRMEDIIGDVLALARHGQTVTDTEPVDLETLARQAWGNVETGDASLTVTETLRFAGDRSRLLRLFENLFRNAIEHGGDAVDVEIGLLSVPSRPITDEESLDDEAGRTAGFYVADDGAGIPEDIRDHAFESEFTTSDEGLGIGLWVVKEVASAHGWDTTAAESAAGGARFEFREVKALDE